MADDPLIQKREGPTPNGGARSEARYMDRDGHLCPKSRASAVEIVEFDSEDQVIFRTTGRLKSPLAEPSDLSSYLGADLDDEDLDP